MKDVYRRASQVIVWLGEDSEHTVPGFRMLHGISSLYDLDEAEPNDLLSSLVLDDHFRSYWVALGNLLLRPWWYRIWAVQEICLARGALLVCGQYAVDWDHIQKSTAALFVCMDVIDELTEATAFSNPEVGSAFRGFRRGMSRLKLFRLVRLYMDRRERSNENSYALLGVAQNSLSSNPRDKIYAMRGLAEELCWNSQLATIPVDYNISVCDLFMRIAQALYSEKGDVSFLDQVERTTIKGGKRNFDLPSWVPDWTLPTSYGQLLRDGVRNSINGRLPK
jgi:Heterokaryon incompatibility protein (HET)